MRTANGITGLMIVLLAAAGASAANPIQIRLLGPAAPVELGEDFTVDIEVTTETPLILVQVAFDNLDPSLVLKSVDSEIPGAFAFVNPGDELAVIDYTPTAQPATVPGTFIAGTVTIGTSEGGTFALDQFLQSGSTLSTAVFDAAYTPRWDIDVFGSSVTISDFIPGNWAHSMPLYFANYQEAGTLTDFPVLVFLHPQRVDYDEFGSPDDGADLRFTNQAGTLLDHEIEQWTRNGNSYIWVRVPEITAAEDFITMHWGNASASDAQNPAAVWNSTYTGVWHLNETFASDEEDTPDAHVDSSGQQVPATRHNNYQTPGAIAGGQSLNNAMGDQAGDGGPLDWIDMEAPASDLGIDADNPRTISFWLYPYSDGGNSFFDYHPMFGYGKHDFSKAQVVFFFYSITGSGTSEKIIDYGGVKQSFFGGLAGDWRYVTYVYDGSVAKVYIDGGEASSKPLSGLKNLSHKPFA